MIAKESKIGLVVPGLLLAILMAAMDNTIVATAMGTIVNKLGGFDKLFWVTSAYMAASMAGMPIFGKLSDMYGRKRFFIFGLLLFIVGSILCGTATSIIQLSIYRAIQGIGGGALMPITFTIIFDIFPPEKRGKMTGLFGAVFGISSVVGPLLGAYITDNFGWEWIFYINLPLGIISLILVSIFYKESLEHSKQRIDWLGALSLIIAIVCLMFALEWGGNQYAWDSTMIIGLFSAFAILFLIFLYVETKVAEPVISFTMFKTQLFAASTIVSFFYGATFVIASVYIPIFIQGVFGGSATNSGLILMPMMLGVVVAAQVGGILSTKVRYRSIIVISAIIFVTGIYLLSTISTDTERYMITIFMIIAGLGTGASFSVLPTASIHNFDVRQRGSANSTLTFLRSLGMTLGITIFGIIQRNIFTDNLKTTFAGMGPAPSGMPHDPRVLLSPAARAHIPPFILDKLTGALASSIAHTFMWALIPATLALVFAFFMGNARLQAGEKKAQPAVQE